VHVNEVIAVIRKDVRLLDGKALGDASAEGERKSSQIESISFAVGEAIALEEVHTDCNESSVVQAKITRRHVVKVLCLFHEMQEVVVRVTMSVVEMRVQTKDFVLELCEGGVGVAEGGEIFPGLTFRACITTGPSDSFSFREAGAISKLGNTFKEFFESSVIGCEARRVTSTSEWHVKYW
jgi:hypothetical protein